jgi:uncharacterized protein (DUF1501 family)
MAATIGDRYLVVLQLEGGNDGLNTVVPYNNGSGSLRDFYEVARLSGSGGLRIPAAQLAVPTVLPMVDPNTGAQLGFHPGLASLGRMYDRGQVAVIQGCGYPDYSLSHEESRIAWQTGNPLGVTGYSGTGWAGRHLAAEYGGGDIPAVAISNSIALEFRQVRTNVLATPRFDGFDFPFDDYDPADKIAYRAALTALHGSASASGQSALAYLGSAGTATLEAAENFSTLHAFYESNRASWSSQYEALDSGTANRLREVAKAINGVRTNRQGIHARFFHVANGGYDTHSKQGAGAPTTQHYRLLSEIGDALEVFYADLEDMGVADRTLTVVWSEFSRRIEQNEDGTDHGSQGPMFAIGPVNGGVYGNHPDIDPLALDDRGNTVYSQAPPNGYRSTDFRDVYGTVLKHWLNISPTTILSSVLPVDPGPATDYWTVANLDLGFL